MPKPNNDDARLVVPTELHTQLKVFCALNQRDMKSVATEALTDYISRNSGQEPAIARA